MRVYHFVEVYLQHTETFIYNFVRASSQHASEVIVVCFGKKNIEQFPLPANTKLVTLSSLYFNKRSIKGFARFLFEKIIRKPIWYEVLHRHLKANPPAVVHCHFGPLGVCFGEFLNFHAAKIPFVTSFYGYDVSELPLRDKEYAHQLNDLWKRSALILSEGPALSSKLVNLGADPNQVRLNPIIIDVKKYPRKAALNGVGNKEINFLFIGRFMEKKGFHLFLEAMGRIQKEIPPFKISIVGSGPLADRYKSIIAGASMEKMVTFEGNKTLQECFDYLLRTDVFVHPSVTASNGDSEGGAPTIIIEAQAIGVPVITSDHADIPFIMGYTDFMAREGDVDDLCRVIRKIIHDESLDKIVESGRRKVLVQHDMYLSHFYPALIAEFDTN